MDKIVSLENGDFQASFLPEHGMTLSHFSENGLEVMDQHSRTDFEHYSAGLGCLIGPHFYLQKEEWIAPVPDPSLFPHLVYTDAKGFKDPFSHGIGRYAPWQYTASTHSIDAHLSGKDAWKGFSLQELEGVDFSMHVQATLLKDGLFFQLSVDAKRLSVIGLHYYFALPKGPAKVTSLVKPEYNDMGVFKPMQKEWMQGDKLVFDLENSADFGFLPKNGHSGEIELETSSHKLHISYEGKNNEVSWQLYHPKGSSFVCIEPMSVKNPRGLNTCRSSLKVKISISS